MIREYLGYLHQEICRSPCQASPLTTIFFGGGTPSLLSPAQVAAILDLLQKCMGIDPQAEISLEVDPGTFSRSQLRGYAQAGVNRLSLGVQAFQDPLLQVCGRSHQRSDIDKAAADIHEAGFENWSLDLISGLPGQTLDHWQESLNQAIALEPRHISAYDLVVEPVTVFGKRYQPDVPPLPSHDLASAMYQMAHDTLTSAGFDHYEISNYGQPGYHCRHNQVYWRNQPYYGFGMGATSYLGQRRLSRPRTRQAYYAWVDHLPQNLEECPVDSQSDRWLETLMLGLRLAEGLSLDALRQEFPAPWINQLIKAAQPHITAGHLYFEGDRLALRVTEGFLVSNSIILSLWNSQA